MYFRTAPNSWARPVLHTTSVKACRNLIASESGGVMPSAAPRRLRAYMISVMWMPAGQFTVHE